MGAENVPRVVDADVIADDTVRLTLDAAPPDHANLAYAWGHQNTSNECDHSANHGALRDRWQQPSKALDGMMLHRFALPGRVPLTRHE